MNITLIIIIGLAAAVLTATATALIVRNSSAAKLAARDERIRELEVSVKGLEKDVEYKEREIESARVESEKAHKQQLETIKSQISVESEKILKERQEELSKNAKETFGTIAGDFNKNLQEMKTAFEANKKTQTESSTELKTHLEQAVKHLKDQTESIGHKADNLADALRGQNKMQGCWGETQLANILMDEGLQEGRDFDREETLRDELGIVLHNEDTGKRMRPDFILHYPDNTDIIVDCKVSLNALSDYMSARDDAERNAAAERNLKAVHDQVDCLSRKDYASYLRHGHKCLDFTVMFIPNVNALVLARQLDPLVVAKAYRKGVLITSEETFIPFLSLVRAAWVNTEQARNQEKIIRAAERMVDRVSEFCEAYNTIGKKLNEAVTSYNKGKSKIADNGQSILKSAHEVMALGIKGKKALPSIESLEVPETLEDAVAANPD